MLEAAGCPETSVDIYKSVERHISEDSCLHRQDIDNLRRQKGFALQPFFHEDHGDSLKFRRLLPCKQQIFLSYCYF